MSTVFTYSSTNKLRIEFLVLLITLFISSGFRAGAQCNNWNISVSNIQASACAANGSFTVNLSGPDLANLANIQYSIPLTAGGFSVLPNASPSFAGIPAGTYTVKAEGTCNLSLVTKTTTVTIGGNYTSPTLNTILQRGSLNCGNYGIVSLVVMSGLPPYTVKILSKPTGYTGATTFNFSTSVLVLDKLPAGNYTFQATDDCGTATPVQTIAVTSLLPDQVPLGAMSYSGVSGSCNKVYIYKPSIQPNNDPNWNAYQNNPDSVYEVAYSINGGATVSPWELLDGKPFLVTLPAGKTYKDLYNTQYILYFRAKCGSVFQRTSSFGGPYLGMQTVPKCNTGFVKNITVNGSLICYPVTITIQNTATSTTYGPYTNNGGTLTTQLLPFGTYTISYTTADGYSGNSGFTEAAPPPNPYSGSIITEAYGLNNYFRGFSFFRSGGVFTPGTSIKLLSGPPGYACSTTASGQNNYETVSYNLAAPNGTNKYFKAGTYIWEIKDDCGTNTISVNVDSVNLYHYTLDLSNRQQTCNGLKVFPSGTGTVGTNQLPQLYYQILDGPPGYSGQIIGNGDHFLLNVPGTYTIGISSNSNFVTLYDYILPNPYQVTDTIVYDDGPLRVDINNTQGFQCIGASSGQGQIVIAGMDGIPFKSPAKHYKYYLAAQGNGVSGPYISNNITGTFSGLGMTANTIYDLKIEDSCGAFVVQPVKVLDLNTTSLLSVTGSAWCEGDSIELHALTMPGATYSWVGPNGFTSSLRDPVIKNVTTGNNGKYTVTIITSFCSMPASGSVDIHVNPAPPKATISVNCIDTTAILSTTAIPGVDMQWYKNGDPINGMTGASYTATTAGVYVLHTIFPTTGCRMASDSVWFSTTPGVIYKPTVAADKKIICNNDSATLEAISQTPVVSYQWYFNGAAVNGAILPHYKVAKAGYYSVLISTGPCSEMRSDSITIEVLTPFAGITPMSDTVFCEGDSVVFYANTGMNLSYIWLLDGKKIPGVSTNVFTAKEPGIYTVEVYNGYCTAVSKPVHVVVNPLPVANISPGGDVAICEGRSAVLMTPEQKDCNYQWYKDGMVIPYEIAYHYTTSVAGTYSVVVSNGLCPDDTDRVVVRVLPVPVAMITPNGPVEFCEGGSVLLSASPTGDMGYTWYRDQAFIQEGAENTYEAKQSGGYSVVVDNKACADTSETLIVTAHPLPEPEIIRNELRLSTGVYKSYQWLLEDQAISGAEGQFYMMPQTGNYSVIVTNEYGCSGKSEQIFVASLEEACIVRLPSAFTPNGDGSNDVFRLIGYDEYQLQNFQVRNRWGQVVFETTNKTDGWNGTFNGVPQDAGTYFYLVKYKCDKGDKDMIRRGDVQLIR